MTHRFLSGPVTALASLVLSVAIAGPVSASVPPETANDAFFNVVKKANKGQRAALRKVATKPAVRHLMRAHNQGYRFAKPNSECTQDDSKPANRYECSTSVYYGDQLSGTLFVVIKHLDSGFRTVRADVAYGE